MKQITFISTILVNPLLKNLTIIAKSIFKVRITLVIYSTLFIAINYANSQNNFIELTSSNLKVKLDKDRGGVISYISKSTNTRNLVNTSDNGRYITPSFWAGEAVNRLSEGQNPTWSPFRWNPVQTGDSFSNNSQLISYNKTGNTIYTKCIPMLYDMPNMPAEATIEQWTTLDGNTISVHGKLTCNRTDNIYGEDRFLPQEIPAILLITSLHKLCYYEGSSPFNLNSPISYSAYTVKDPGNPNSGWGIRYSDEDWIAFLDNNNWGLAVYCPNAHQFSEGMVGAENKESYDAETSYLAAVKFEKLKKESVYEFDYHLVIDNISNIRNKIVAIHNNSPKNLVATNISFNSIDLSWTAPLMNQTYDIYIDGKNIGSTTSTSYTISGLSSSTIYDIEIKIQDPITKVNSTSPILTVSTSSTEGRFRNYSFESPIAQENYYYYTPSLTQSFWTFAGGGVCNLYSSVFNGGYQVPDGIQAAFLHEGNKISQQMSFSSNRFYSISFMAKKSLITQNVSGLITLQLTVGSNSIGTFTPSSTSSYTLYKSNIFQASGVNKVEFNALISGPSSPPVTIDNALVDVFLQNELLSNSQYISGYNISINSDDIGGQFHGSVKIINGSNVFLDITNSLTIYDNFEVEKGSTFEVIINKNQ
nr:hypothetical protein [uncultured Draconibacterium sp.]